MVCLSFVLSFFLSFFLSLESPSVEFGFVWTMCDRVLDESVEKRKCRKIILYSELRIVTKSVKNVIEGVINNV